MYSNEGNRFVNLDRPVKAVALDPGYSRPGTNRRYVSGDDKLVLNEKGIFSTNRSFVLHQGEGPIRNIKWRVSIAFNALSRFSVTAVTLVLALTCKTRY